MPEALAWKIVFKSLVPNITKTKSIGSWLRKIEGKASRPHRSLQNGSTNANVRPFSPSSIISSSGQYACNKRVQRFSKRN